MIYYCDSSAVSKIYLEEAGSAFMRNIRHNAPLDELFINDITGPEVLSALHRRFRAGDLTSEIFSEAQKNFRRDYFEFFHRVSLAEPVLVLAMQLIEKYPLIRLRFRTVGNSLAFAIHFASLRRRGGSFCWLRQGTQQRRAERGTHRYQPLRASIEFTFNKPRRLKMSEMIRGIYRNGVIEPAEPLKIAEGTEVYVTVPRKRSREELIELLLKLKEKGIVDFDPTHIGEPFPDIEPVKIKGGPMSDTIIEGRGPR